MADKFSMNYAMDSTNHVFSAIWKLTRVMKAAGWNVIAHSDGTTKTAAGTNANDSWGNNADPLNDTYPAFDTPAPWIVMQGPSTVKLMLASAPTGTFVRGESVTQSTSSATGEILGIVWDSDLSVGWAIIQPRTGTFNGSNTVTGAISSAIFTPSSYKSFTREIVFAKQASNTYSGSSFYICADASAESADLFSTLAASSGCTATIPPGCGGTGNGFPTIAIALRGTGGSVSHTTWIAAASTGFTGLANLAATNVTPAAGVSADGTFYAILGRTDTSGVHALIGLFRLDDTEPGDVDPYAIYWNSGNSMAAFSRTSATSYASYQYDAWYNVTQKNYAVFRGYAARDAYVVARDVVIPFVATYRNTTPSSFYPQMNNAQPLSMEVQNHPSSFYTYIREPAGLSSTGQTSNIRMVKGNIRWMNFTPVGQLKDTFDNKKWVCLSNWSNGVAPGMIIGPWDGVTVPG